MERNKQLKIIRAINTKLNELERQRNVYLNLLCEDISGDTEEYIRKQEKAGKSSGGIKLIEQKFCC